MPTMAREQVTVTIVAQDEESRIADAIRSVSWADEILVLDGGSEDLTVELSRELGARVEEHAWDGYASQKQRAVELARHDWIFGLDADEALSEELAHSVQVALEAPAHHVAFACNRRNHYLGRPIRWGGWYPDRRVRLFHRGHGRWIGPDPHDTVQTDGPVGFLPGDLEHRSYQDVHDHVRAIRRLAAVWADSMHALGRRARPWDTTLRPLGHFLKNYLLRLGVLEGRRGLLICGLGAWHVATRYRALRERWLEEPP